MADMLRELTGMPAEEGACRAPTSNAEPAEYCCTIIAHDALRPNPAFAAAGFLEMAGGDVEAAVAMFFEMQGGAHRPDACDSNSIFCTVTLSESRPHAQVVAVAALQWRVRHQGRPWAHRPRLLRTRSSSAPARLYPQRG